MNRGAQDRTPAFRGDVQGMRAVAVLVVVAAHLSVPGMAGGFVGVDVFLVVSGFLITRLTLHGIATEGRFSPTAFYARRARRIVPAAGLVILVTVVASGIYLTFIDALDVTRDALFALFFVANLRFAQEGVDYFSADESPSPLQHYWSLAVEEQFYLVWPVLVVAAVLATRRRRREGDVPLRTLGVLVLVVGAASLAWSVHRTVAEPAAAYFGSLTRAWELALGALLALAVWAGRTIRRRLVTEPLALAGLAGIAAAVVAFDAATAFPGYAALLPTLSAAALLLAGANPGSVPLVSRLLATGPLRRVGDWSFSLYLWHWPVVIIPQVHLGRGLTVTESLVAVAITFQLAYLTYRFVEQPFRTGAVWRSTPRRGLAIYPATILLVLPATLGVQAWAQWLGSERGDDPPVTPAAYGVADDDEATAIVEASVAAARADQPVPSDLTPDLVDLSADLADLGDCNYLKPARDLCRRGDPGAEKVMVVTGDSHARAWIPAFEEMAQKAGYAVYYLVKQQCTAAFVDPGRLYTGAEWPDCEEFHDWVVEQVTALEPDLMVVATSPPPTGVWTDEGEYVDSRKGVLRELGPGFADMFAAYRPLADRTVLLADVPRLPEDPGTCLATPGNTMADCTFEPTPWSEQVRGLSLRAAAEAGAETVDPLPWMCADDRCPAVIGSTIAYRDRGHLSATRAGELWLALGAELGLLRGPEAPSRSGSGG